MYFISTNDGITVILWNNYHTRVCVKFCPNKIKTLNMIKLVKQSSGLTMCMGRHNPHVLGRTTYSEENHQKSGL